MSAGHGTLTRYKHGPDEHDIPGRPCRCAPCAAASKAYNSRRRRMIAYGQWATLIDATGTRRRLQALAWGGWSLTHLSARLGWTRDLARQVTCRARVTRATAEKVRVLYDELCLLPPPEETHGDRISAAKARRHARSRGWAPVGAWDDDPGPHCIDDPVARPAGRQWRGEAS